MDKKWLNIAIVSFAGIVISGIILSFLHYFSGAGSGNYQTIMNTMPMGVNNMYVYTPMNQYNYYEIQQQLTDIKTMIGIGMPIAIGVGLLNFWRGFIKK